MTNNTPNHAAFATLFCLYIVRNKATTGKIYTNTFLCRLDADGTPAQNDKGFLIMSEVDTSTVEGLAAMDLGMVPTEHNASRKSRMRWISLQIKGQDADTSAPGVLSENCLEYVETMTDGEQTDLISTLDYLATEYADDTTPRGVRRLYNDARDYLGKVRQYAPRAVSHEQATARHCDNETARKAHANLMPWICALLAHLTGDETPADAHESTNTTQDTTDAPSVACATTETPSKRDRLKVALQKKATQEYVPGSFLSRLAEHADERETAQDDPTVFDMTDLDDLFSQI